MNNRTVFSLLCVIFVFYSVYVYTRGTEHADLAPMTAKASHGQILFQTHNCIACHQFYGLGGYMGPDLTNVISQRGPEYTRAFLMAGTARMPNYHLSDDEMDALVAYLAFVDQTGTYPPKNYQITWYGTVQQEDDPE